MNVLLKACMAFVCAMSVCLCCDANTIEAYNPRDYDNKITKLYQSIPAKNQSINDRITWISHYFLGKPYMLGTLGEGPDGDFDQHPLYRTDSFDCVTYVSTVLALAHAQNLQQFQQKIRRIRYLDGKVSFTTRNHFMSVDWNPNNTQQGMVRDITYQMINRRGDPIAKIANTVIDKASWYQHFTRKNLQYLDPAQDTATRLVELKNLGKQYHKVRSVLLYIPLAEIFDSRGKVRNTIFSQIPNAAIVEIVRPNWPLKNKIGTNMQISHLGFAIWQNGILYYREASSLKKRVIDIPLSDYLRPYRQSPTVKGISILSTT